MYRQAVGEYTEEFLREAFNTNVISAMMLSSESVKHLEKTEGAIIFLGSIHTRRAYPGATPYATTKAAVEGLTRVMAAELAVARSASAACFPARCPRRSTCARACSRRNNRTRAMPRLHQTMRSVASVRRRRSQKPSNILARAEWVTGVALEVDGGLGLGVSNF